ncbi:hypothetical protein HYE68_004821 [Fusarium pseudograminearum]|nr:hypothetical protein HYE68_004821 [Fusarium pseudograminearum]
MELSMPSMFRAYAILWYLRDGGVDSFRARSQSLTRWRELVRPVKRIGGVDDQSQTARRPNGLELPTPLVRPELPGLPTGPLPPQRRAKLERRLSVVPATS